MKKTMKKLSSFLQKDQLAKQSLTMIAVTFVAGAISYFYHIVMGRMLSVSDYGVLASIISIVYILNVPAGTIQATIAKFVAEFKAKGKEEKISALLSKSFKKVLFFALLLFFAIILVSPLLGSFLHISSFTPLLVLAFVAFSSLLVPVGLGALQGLQKFGSYNVYSLVGSSSKIFFAVVFVWIGFGVSGALFAFVVSSLLGAIPIIFSLKGYFKKSLEAVEAKKVYLYSIPTMVSLFFFMLLFNIDLILVKHFFSSFDAGIYGAASTLGKVMYFGSLAVVTVFFPKIASAKSVGEKTSSLLKKAMLYSGIFCLLVFLAYLFFSKQIILILLGEKFLLSASLLPLFGFAMFLFSFSNVLVYYFLALGNKRLPFILAFFVVLEIALIIIFHRSLFLVLQIFSALMVLLLVVLIFEFFASKGR